jgi:hypothetical protein
MGNSTSSSSSDILSVVNNSTELDNSIKNKINQDCNMTTLQSNVINIVGSTVKKLSATQNNSIQSMCVMQSILKSDTSTEVVNKLLDKIKSNVETSGALLGSPAVNNTISKSFTENRSKIDNSKFNEVSKNCILDTSQTNLLNIIGSNVEDTETDQANAAFLECLASHSDDTMITNDMLNDTVNEKDNASKAQGGDLLKSAGEGIGTAAKGIGEGVGTGAKGVGEGASSALSSISYPLMIGSVVSGLVCCIVCAILLYMMFSNPEAAQSLSESGMAAFKNR